MLVPFGHCCHGGGLNHFPNVSALPDYSQKPYVTCYAVAKGCTQGVFLGMQNAYTPSVATLTVFIHLGETGLYFYLQPGHSSNGRSFSHPRSGDNDAIISNPHTRMGTSGMDKAKCCNINSLIEKENEVIGMALKRYQQTSHSLTPQHVCRNTG